MEYIFTGALVQSSDSGIALVPGGKVSIEPSAEGSQHSPGDQARIDAGQLVEVPKEDPAALVPNEDEGEQDAPEATGENVAQVDDHAPAAKPNTIRKGRR